jgi:hypothetical protein
MKKLFLYLILTSFLLASFISPIFAADVSMNLMVLDNGNYRLSWSIKDDVISMHVSAKTNGWLAIGFDPSEKMKDADMIIGYFGPKNTSKVIDSFSVGLNGPHPDDVSLGGTDDLISSSVTQKNGWTTMNFQRKLVTGDKFDKDIPQNKAIKVIWSYGTTANIKTYHETSRGTATINFTDGTGSQVTNPATKTDPVKQEEKKNTKPIGFKTFLLLHILLMSLTLLSMLSAVSMLTIFKKKTWWFKTHKSLLFVTITSFILGFISAILLVTSLGTGHFQGLHKLIGLCAFILSLGFLLLSIFHPWKQNLRKLFRNIHLWIARTLILLFIINIFLGIKLAQALLGK